MAYDTWTVVNTVPTPHALAQWSSICTISNGYLGLKGTLCEERGGQCPVTLINGVFDELDMFGLIRPSNQPRPYLDPCFFDTAGRSPAVANLPSPLLVQVFIDDRELSLTRGGVSNFSQAMDLATGVFRYQFDYSDGWGRTTRVAMQRFASLVHAHRVFMRYTLTPLDHERTPIRVHSGINGNVFSNTTRERQFEVTQVWADPPMRCRLVARTPARGHEVQVGVVNLPRSGQPVGPPGGVAEHDAVYTRLEYVARRGEPIILERCIVLTCSEDLRHRCVADLESELEVATGQGFEAALVEQRAAWSELWARGDVQLSGDDPAQLGLRFCLFHLMQVAPRFSDRLSVPVKLLTGEFYQGNTFYDAETHILPYYTFTQPAWARTCLDFRHAGLRPAREIARDLGYAGAKFAWQAGPQGEECLGRWWRFTHTNIHINAAVAYALMQYAWVTGDDAYIVDHGLDILVETARFYAARAVHDLKRDAYDLRDVSGPDEGHCESTNNFYTNYLAGRNLRWAADMLDRSAREQPASYAAVARRLALSASEPELWRRVADRLPLLLDQKTGVYEQYDGFKKLEPAPADLLEERRVWWVPVFAYQAINQPDVVMALAMFRDDFPLSVLRANWEYYQPRCLNFSSMSYAINAIAAADAGDADEAYRNFILTCGSDLDEGLTGRKDTYAGLHGTACGGAWLAAVCGFGGLCLSERGLRLRPNLPRQWDSLRFNLVLRGVSVAVTIGREQVELQVGDERRLNWPITVGGKEVILTAGSRHVVAVGGRIEG